MNGTWKRGSCVAVAAIALAGASLAAGPDDVINTARLTRLGERLAVERAIRGALRQLGHGECQGLLDEFADASGRPLRAALEAQAVDAGEYLNRVFFYDASESACERHALAVTKPGSHAVFVCGARFARELTRNSRNAEAAIIHEMLHSLGLGENPPSSEHISTRVLARCGQRGQAAPAGVTPPAPTATAFVAASVAEKP